jgi:hypothetical protein
MSRRRGKGEGSIFQRKDGRWAGFVTLGYTPDGKQKKAWVYGRTRREVAEKLARLLPKAGSAWVADPGAIRLGDYLHTWVEQRAATKGLRPTTVRNYRVYLKHVEPLAHLPLKRLNPLHLRGLMADLGHLSPSVRRHIYQFLRAAFRDAVRAGLLDQNPMEAVDPPRSGFVRPARAWRPDEVARFLEAAKGHRLYPLFALMLATGLRPGEALALRWEDWEEETLHVRHTLLRDGTLGPTKTPGSNGTRWFKSTIAHQRAPGLKGLGQSPLWPFLAHPHHQGVGDEVVPGLAPGVEEGPEVAQEEGQGGEGFPHHLPHEGGEPVHGFPVGAHHPKAQGHLARGGPVKGGEGHVVGPAGHPVEEEVLQGGGGEGVDSRQGHEEKAYGDEDEAVHQGGHQAAPGAGHYHRPPPR